MVMIFKWNEAAGYLERDCAWNEKTFLVVTY